MTKGQSPSDSGEHKIKAPPDASHAASGGHPSFQGSDPSERKLLRLPFSDEQVATLRAGEWVALEGDIYVVGWQASRRLLAALDDGEPWPFDPHPHLILHATPAPAPLDSIIGILEPDPSRFYDPLTLKMLEAGARGFLGYGPRGDEVLERMKKRRSLYFVLPAAVGALLSRCVVESEIVAFPELKQESVRRIRVSGFPALLAVDGFGRNLFVRKAMTGSFPTLVFD